MNKIILPNCPMCKQILEKKKENQWYSLNRVESQFIDEVVGDEEHNNGNFRCGEKLALLQYYRHK